MELETESANGAAVQSVQRAAQLLRLVTQTADGARFSELVQGSGLPKPTAHRLLRQLVASGLLVQQPASRRYELGPAAFEIGLAASRAYPLRELAQPFLEEVSRCTGDAVVLVVRSEADAVCVDRKLGSYPLHTVEPGCRRPMGVGAAGLAILSFLDEDERNRCLEDIRHKLEVTPYGKLSIPVLHGFLAETRDRGWAHICNFGAPGVAGVGVPLLDRQHRPFGAMAIRAATGRMTRHRVGESARLLQAMAAQLERKLADSLARN